MEQNPKQNSTKQQIVERLKTASNVLVTVSKDPSVDVLSACIGITLLLNKLDKHAAAVFSGDTPSSIEFLKPGETLEKTPDSLRDFIISLDKSKADKLRYKVEDDFVKIFITPYHASLSQEDFDFSQGDFNVDVILALGVHEREELDGAITAHGRILHDATVITVNNTTASELGTLNWNAAKVGSLSEMLADLAEGLDKKALDAQIATAFLTGIVAETEQFSNNKTTSQTMMFAGHLIEAGANPQLVATKLDMNVTADAPSLDMAPQAESAGQTEAAHPKLSPAPDNERDALPKVDDSKVPNENDNTKAPEGGDRGVADKNKDFQDEPAAIAEHRIDDKEAKGDKPAFVPDRKVVRPEGGVNPSSPQIHIDHQGNMFPFGASSAEKAKFDAVATGPPRSQEHMSRSDAPELTPLNTDSELSLPSLADKTTGFSTTQGSVDLLTNPPIPPTQAQPLQQDIRPAPSSAGNPLFSAPPTAPEPPREPLELDPSLTSKPLTEVESSVGSPHVRQNQSAPPAVDEAQQAVNDALSGHPGPVPVDPNLAAEAQPIFAPPAETFEPTKPAAQPAADLAPVYQPPDGISGLPPNLVPPLPPPHDGSTGHVVEPLAPPPLPPPGPPPMMPPMPPGFGLPQDNDPSR